MIPLDNTFSSVADNSKKFSIFFFTKQKMNWDLQPKNVLWKSVRAKSRLFTQGRWAFQKESIGLKDTRQGYYNNTMEDNTFTYQLPFKPKGWEQSIVDALKMGALNYDFKSVAGYLQVSLFSVANGRDHYLGEYVVVGFTQTSECCSVRLHRLELQAKMNLYKEEERLRSNSEQNHKIVLEEELLKGWCIQHEPMCACNFDVPLVLDGRINAWASGEYTVDFVATFGGLLRLCFESKVCKDDAYTEEALEKCRHLRDKSMTRVITIFGHGEHMRFLDFGSPDQVDDSKEIEYTLEQMRQKFGAEIAGLFGLFAPPSASN